MISFPWDSIVDGIDEDGYPILDRALRASQMWDIYKSYFSNGVFMPRKNDELGYFAITPGSGMTVQVDTGRCNINGCFGIEPDVRELMLNAATSDDRIDTVVLRFDNNIEKRSIDLYVKKGVASSSPQRPALTRNETIYELGLADIYIPAGASTISASRITDTRLETSRCGIVQPLLEIDTTTFYNQLQDAVDKAVAAMERALDGTTAGHLQNLIDERVKIAGDTMTGNLKISKNNPVLTLVNSSGDGDWAIAVSESSNNLYVYDQNKRETALSINGSTDVVNLLNPLPITSGGTNAKTAKEARNNLGVLFSLGTNITGGSANDTPEFWLDKEPGLYYFTQTGQLKNQPSQYGWLINIKNSVNSVLGYQFFCCANSGNLYTRYWNSLDSALTVFKKAITRLNDGVFFFPKNTTEYSFQARQVNVTLGANSSSTFYFYYEDYGLKGTVRAIALFDIQFNLDSESPETNSGALNVVSQRFQNNLVMLKIHNTSSKSVKISSAYAQFVLIPVNMCTSELGEGW